MCLPRGVVWEFLDLIKEYTKDVIFVPLNAMVFGEISGKGVAKSLQSYHVGD